MGQIYFYVDCLIYFLKGIYKNKDMVHWNSNITPYFLFHVHMWANNGKFFEKLCKEKIYYLQKHFRV